MEDHTPVIRAALRGSKTCATTEAGQRHALIAIIRRKQDYEIVGDLAVVCAQIVLIWLY